MKKTLLLISSLLLACNLIFSQVILTHKTHGLVAGALNPMKLIEYIEAGNGGLGVVWDFSMIKEKEDFQGELFENTGLSPAAAGTNVVLKEFNNRFVFSASEDKLEQYGSFYGEGGDSYTRYDEPFVKMKYPFAYGSAYAGSFSGGQYQGDKKISGINGNYEISADGSGTLILPNGITYKKALRVKEVKRTSYNNSILFEEVTYRWYLQNYRFPVLVFIKSGTANGSCTSFLSAYNPKATDLKSTTSLDDSKETIIQIFPNPASNFISAKIVLVKDSKVEINLYDAAGKYLGNIVNNNFTSGEQTFTISAKEKSLKFGLYFLNINIDGNESVKNFIIE